LSTITPVSIPAGTYNVDPSHSSVGFEVKHMGIATVRGEFRTFQGTLDLTGDAVSLAGTVEKNPQITFRSTSAEASENGAIRLAGEITIKGITQPIELNGVIAENGEDPWGNQRVGVEVEGTVDRREFELKWNQTLPNGNLLVSNNVKLVVSVSAVKAA
jgi:polyisoprenoid-binding protein YceI